MARAEQDRPLGTICSVKLVIALMPSLRSTLMEYAAVSLPKRYSNQNATHTQKNSDFQNLGLQFLSPPRVPLSLRCRRLHEAVLPGEGAPGALDDDAAGVVAGADALGDVLALDELRQEPTHEGVTRTYREGKHKTYRDTSDIDDTEQKKGDTIALMQRWVDGC